MSDVQTKKPARRGVAIALLVLAGIGVLAILYVIVSSSFKPGEKADLARFKAGAMAKLELPKDPLPAPAVAFADGEGKPVHLADFKGQVVVMNLWADWCAPCQLELPSLGRLQAAYAAQPFQVVAISVDKAENDDLARRDIARAPPLQLYRDPTYAVAFGLTPRAEGFPTTVIYDRKGVERARLSGGADWASPEARALVEHLLQEP
jgi:thiol-disulfide isomerase/thioredoxin